MVQIGARILATRGATAPFLERARIVSLKQLTSSRRYAVVGSAAAVVGAVLVILLAVFVASIAAVTR